MGFGMGVYYSYTRLSWDKNGTFSQGSSWETLGGLYGYR